MHPMQDLFLESFHKYYKLICTPICTKKFILVKSGCYKRSTLDHMSCFAIGFSLLDITPVFLNGIKRPSKPV
jgi:hypothetical protein